MAGPIVNFRGLPPVTPQVEGGPRLSSVGPEGRFNGINGGVQRPFSEFLEEQVDKVNGLHKEADEAVAAMATGRSNNIHEMMIALEKADVSFRMLAKVRNKAVEAYHEVMRMTV